jgi:hypothetical protein
VSRRTIVALGMLALALAGVVAGVVVTVRRDRASLLQRFGSDQLVQVEKQSWISIGWLRSTTRRAQ